MKQGAARHALRERGDDLYETVPEATRALLRHENLPPLIWEPCAGRGAISRLLRAAGYEVITTDLVAWPGADEGIQSGWDFLMERAAPQGCSCIVTNPPYKILNPFLRHALTLVERVIVLLPLMRMEGERRSDLIDQHLTHIWAGFDRLPTMHREGWEGPKISKGGVPFGWFHFSAEPHPADQGFMVRRISWGNA